MLKFAVTLFVGVGLLVATACEKGPESNIGNNLSGPYAVLAGDSGFYVVNSSSTGQYTDGSIAWYELNAEGQPVLKSTLSIPRLGTSADISKDKKFIAVSFLGDDRSIRIYEVASTGQVVERSELKISLPDAGYVESLKFFTPTGAASGQYFFQTLTNRQSANAHVTAYTFLQTTEQLFSLPKDLPGGLSEEYSLAFTTPTYMPNHDLFVAFPQATFDNVLPMKTSVFEVISGQWTPVKKEENRDIDIRSGSVAVVNFQKYLQEKNLRNSLGFFPFATTQSWSQGDKTKPKEDANNSGFEYRKHFQHAMAANAGGCFDNKTDTDSTLPSESVLLALDAPGKAHPHIVLMGGWDDVKTKLSALPDATKENYDYLNKVFFPNISTGLFSGPGSEIHENTRVFEMSVADVGTRCVPVWTRMVVERSIAGSEPVYLQIRGEDSSKPVSQELPRAHLGFAAVGNFAVSASFSYDNIAVTKISTTTLERVK